MCVMEYQDLGLGFEYLRPGQIREMQLVKWGPCEWLKADATSDLSHLTFHEFLNEATQIIIGLVGIVVV